MFSEIYDTVVYTKQIAKIQAEVEGKEKERESTWRLDELHYYVSRLSSLIKKKKKKKNWKTLKVFGGARMIWNCIEKRET